MAELSDYDIRQIENSIKEFSDTYNKIVKNISKDRFRSGLEKALSRLNTYSKEEQQALKQAEKTIDKMMNGSGFFSSGGLNKILEKKINESQKQIGGIISDYNDTLNNIYNALPKIGVKGTTGFSFDETDYSGDLDYDNDDFDVDNGNDSTGFSFSTSFSEDEDGETYEVESIVSDSSVSLYSETSPLSEFVTDRKTEVIGINAISNPNLKIIRCTNVKEVKANGFKGCSSLELIVFSKEINSINSNAFRGIPDNCVIAFESDEIRALSCFSDPSCIDGRKVIFDYSNGDERSAKVSEYKKPEPVQEKKIRITKTTPLDSNEIKTKFLERNYKYGLNMEELNKAIELAGTNVDKDAIVYEGLKLRKNRALAENSYWDFANTMGHLLKIERSKGNIEEALSIIYGLLFLDSSGSRMIKGRYNPYLQEPELMQYHPKMELGDLYEIVRNNNLSADVLSEGYRNSAYVKELSSRITNSYYSVEDSIKLMHMALQNPDYPFYPAQSGIRRKN